MLIRRSAQGDKQMFMNQQPSEVETNITENNQPLPYETPAVIYEGVITTRAGSPVGGGDSEKGVDPADLFGS